MAFVCNPNNPTGLLMEPKLLEEIAAKCRKEGILLVVDECFLDLCSHPFAVSAKRELDHNPFLFILKAFTKTYALAGLRIGYGISANQALLKRMRSLAAPWALSGPAQRAALACLDQKDYLSKARRVIESERRALYGCLCRIGEKRGDVSALWGQANFLFFQGPERLDSALLDEGFVIRSCDNFRGLGPGFYRAALAPAPVNGAFISALMRILL